jgi:type 2 lantibiotic biosynthesis protein LanM
MKTSGSGSGLAAPQGLIRAVAPLADRSRRRVRARLAASPFAPTTEPEREALIGELEASLFARLFEAASRTLVLELGVAQQRGLLAGETAQARFAFFCECLDDRRFAAGLLAQYPVLVRRLAALILNWERATLELAGRLGRDLDHLASELLGGADPGAWTGTEALGDSHRGGRTVQRLTFASGARVIYKPRTVAMERGFADLVAWLNERGVSPDLGAAPAIDLGSYGWMQWVEAAPCPDEAAVGAYFRRQGGNLALAYLLGAADLHFENVIAAADYPILVDLEALFHPAPAPTGPGRATRAAARAIRDSVIRTLLLPIYVEDDPDADGEPRGGDPSALGFVGDQAGEGVGEGWEAAGTDAMRLARISAAMPAAACLPELAGRRIAAAPYAEQIVTGFADVYDFLARHRQPLGAPDGPLEAFRGGRSRHVRRATRTYVRLLNRTWHPRFGEDAQAFDADLRAQLSTPNPYAVPPAATRAIEARDLFNGDVPYFTAPVGPKGAWLTCQQRLAGLSEPDKDRQAWIARMTLTTFDAPIVRRPRASGAEAKPEALEAAARTIGDRLCSLAIRRGKGASWLTPVPDAGLQLAPEPLSIDLYNGLAGVALFLGGLTAVTGERRYARLAEAALAEALEILHGTEPERTYLGAHRGVGGLAWTYAVLGRLLERGDWLRQAQRLVSAHAAAAAADGAIDLISGRAGFVAAGMAVAQMAESADLIEAIRPCAESLARLSGADLPIEEDAGLGHGRAGLGLALARWAIRDGDSRGLKRGLGLIRSDLAVAETARRDAPSGWNDEDGRAMLAWCRGGLGAAHAGLWLGRQARRETASVIGALERRSGPTTESPICLCHGALGVLEFLGSAREARVAGAAEAHERLRADVIGRLLAGEFCADHGHRIESPGLMTGLAGSGWALLGMLAPAKIPSVLTLDAI